MTTPTLLSIVSKYNMYTHFWCCRTKTYFKYILVLHTNKSHSALYIICNTLILHILNDRKTESMILLSLFCDDFKKYSCTAHCIFWHWILYFASHCIGTLNLNWKSDSTWLECIKKYSINKLQRQNIIITIYHFLMGGNNFSNMYKVCDILFCTQFIRKLSTN